MGDKTYTVVACNTIAAYHEVTADSPEAAADVFYQEHGTPRTCHACPEADGDGWCTVPLDGEEMYTDQHDPSATTIARLTRERDEANADANRLHDLATSWQIRTEKAERDRDDLQSLSDAYIDIVNRTARALGIPEVDEDGAMPSLHDVPERVAEVVRELAMLSAMFPPVGEPTDDDATQDPPGWWSEWAPDEHGSLISRLLADPQCIVLCGDGSWGWCAGLDPFDSEAEIKGTSLGTAASVGDDAALAYRTLAAAKGLPVPPASWWPAWTHGVCGKPIPGSRRVLPGGRLVHSGCMDVPGHDGPCRFDARADGGEVGDGE